MRVSSIINIIIGINYCLIPKILSEDRKTFSLNEKTGFGIYEKHKLDYQRKNEKLLPSVSNVDAKIIIKVTLHQNGEYLDFIVKYDQRNKAIYVLLMNMNGPNVDNSTLYISHPIGSAFVANVGFNPWRDITMQDEDLRLSNIYVDENVVIIYSRKNNDVVYSNNIGKKWIKMAGTYDIKKVIFNPTDTKQVAIHYFEDYVMDM